MKETGKTFQETNEKNQKELLKEAMRRANKKEKQGYEKISKRQNAVVERVLVIFKEYEELNEESQRNKCPESTPTPDGKRVVAMSTEEFNEWMEQTRREFRESFSWSSKSFSIMSKQMVLIKELFGLSSDLLGLEREEKWLLLSVALRTQPNLMRYIEGGNMK